MSDLPNGTIAVLWGSATKELTWIHITTKHGRETIARAHAGGFWVRQFNHVPDIIDVAARAHNAWIMLRDGRDLPGWATHRLAPPLMRDIEPIPKEES